MDTFGDGSVEDGGSSPGRGRSLTVAHESAIAAACTAVVRRWFHERNEELGRSLLSGRRRTRSAVDGDDVATGAAMMDAVMHAYNVLSSSVHPRATPLHWMRRRTGGTWEDLRADDDTTEQYFREKLRMSRRVFVEISESLAPCLERKTTFYREPLQPDHIVAYALYRWASGETYDSSTCAFGIGRASGLVAVNDVTRALLDVHGQKIAWPRGVRKSIVLRSFAQKGFPNCHGCIDCTHIYVDKPANAQSEDYYDRKRRFSVQAQVVVDLDLRILDVFVGYPGSCHDVRVLQLSSLWRRAEEGVLFTGPPVVLPGGVQTNGYLLGDNGYPPSEWIVTPYGGIHQTSSQGRFDAKQKTARGAVERAFGRLKGMWRLFLRTHKTNINTLSPQFVAVCVLHNILLDAGIPFDENLLWEEGPDGVRRRVDLGIQRPPIPVRMESSTDAAISLRDALAERMGAP